jgi:hypothetical protein
MKKPNPQTPVSVEGDMNWTGSGVDFRWDIRRWGRGRTIMGVAGGVVRLPPEIQRPQCLTIVCPKNCKNSDLQLPIFSTGQNQLRLVPKSDVMLNERFLFELKTLSV